MHAMMILQLVERASKPFGAKGLVRRDGLKTLPCEGSSSEKVKNR